MPPSRLDGLYRRMLITRFFEKGWGKPENLKRLFEFRKIVSNRESCYKLVPKDYPVEITKEEKNSDCTIIEGKFMSPLELHLPGLVPKAAQEAHFQVLLPQKWTDERHKPVCIHLAGTGDHYYWRRRNFIAKPLLREGNLGAIILENPFYGARKPEDQVRSNLHNVSDIFVMGGCLILESLVLLHWCERNGLGPLGITGLSMGGHMASLAATNWPKPLVLVPCLSWSTAAAVFTTGVMSQSINWDMLETQYFSDGNYRERLAKMVTVIDDAFVAGQHFVKNFNQSMFALKHDIDATKDFHNDEQPQCLSSPSGSSIVDRNSTNLNNNNSNNQVQEPSFPSKAQLIHLDEKNSLGLNEDLHKKLMSNDCKTLTNSEINELNYKIRNELTRIQLEKFAKKPTEISTSTLQNNDKSIAHDAKPESVQEKFSKTEVPSTVSNNNQSNSLIPKDSIDDSSAMTKLMRYILPRANNGGGATSPAPEKIDITKTKWWEREALQFMRGMMDECTHLKNFSVPYDTSLIIAVCAKDDAYVPREGCSSLEEIWPGVEVKYLDAGHVSAYVLHQKLFRSSIIEAFERAKKKRDETAQQNINENLNIQESELTYEELYQNYLKAKCK